MSGSGGDPRQPRHVGRMTTVSTESFVEPTPTPLALLLLGRGADPDSERGVECPGDLPAASDPGLVERARAAKAALGDRVFVLGHHYQRDEVIEFADVTGDSFKLAPRRRGPPRRRVHRVLRRALHGRERRHPHRPRPGRDPARPRRRLLDGRHGRDRPGRGRWDVLADAGHRRRHDPDHLHELHRRHQGVHRPQRRRRVHVVQRASGRSSGRSSRARRCSSCPTSTSAATPPCSSSASRSTTAWSTTRTSRSGGLTADAAARREGHPVAGPLLGARPLHPRVGRRRPRAHPRRQRAGAPRVQARGRHGRRLRRLDRVHHQDPRGRAAPAAPGRSAPSSTS